MSLDALAPPPKPPRPDTPGDRATTFQPVEGGEVRSGEALLIEAYAAIWIFLFAFLAYTWRRQVRVDARLAELERVVDRAALRESGAHEKRGDAATASEP